MDLPEQRARVVHGTTLGAAARLLMTRAGRLVMQYVAEVRSSRKRHTNGGHFWGTNAGQKNDNRLSVIIFLASFCASEMASIFGP